MLIRNPDWLFEAVARLLKKGEVSASDFRLCFYVDVQGKSILTDLAHRYGVEAVTECFDLLPAELRFNKAGTLSAGSKSKHSVTASTP